MDIKSFEIRHFLVVVVVMTLSVLTGIEGLWLFMLYVVFKNIDMTKPKCSVGFFTN